MEIVPTQAIRTPYATPPSAARTSASEPVPAPDAAIIGAAPLETADAGPRLSPAAKGVVITLLATAAIGGVMVGIAGQAHADEPAPTSISTTVPPRVSSPNVAQKVADRAIDSLVYLDQTGTGTQGGLYVETLGIWQHKVTPQQAFYKMADGGTVEYVEHKGAVPHEIRTFDDLETLRDQVQQQEIRNSIDRGVNEIKKGAREAGKVLQDIGDQIRRGFEQATDR